MRAQIWILAGAAAVLLAVLAWAAVQLLTASLILLDLAERSLAHG